MAQPQKSEVHETTADASTSPTGDGDASTTAKTPGDATSPSSEVVRPDVDLNSVVVVQDDSDVGGPVVLASSDPALKEVKVPVDPFPTDRMPEIDPPVKK